MQASSRQEAALAIKAKDLQVLTIKNIDTGLRAVVIAGVSVAEKAELSRFLATMLRAGISLPEAVDIIRQEMRNQLLKKILVDIAFQTRKGSSLSSVLAKYPKVFDPVFLTMVKAGEESGTLDQSFDYLAQQLLNTHEMTQKVKGSLIYPAVIVAAMLGNGILMITFVLPKISEVISKLPIEPPLLTRLVLKFGNFVSEHTAPVLVGIFVLFFIAFLVFFIRKTRSIVFSAFSKFPAVKKLVTQIDMSRFARTLSTLLKSGVPVMDALDVSADMVTQARVRKEAKKFSKGVAEGESLSEMLVKSRKVFPVVMIQTVRAGEKTGTLEKVLMEMAEFYEREVEHTLKRLTALLEPVLMLVVGLAVGAMVLIMITPIYSIVGGLEGL